MQEPVPGISAVPDEQNARYFHVVVAGKFNQALNQRQVFEIRLCLQDRKVHLSRAACSSWSYSCQRTTLCQLPKCDLSLKSTIRTLISSDVSA